MDINQLKKIQSKLRQINKAKVTKMFEEEILANEDNILNKVKDRWTKGVRPTGDIIGVYKNVDYALFKNTINPLAKGNVDLTVTRSLRNKLEIFPEGNGNFNIFSRDKKADKIADKYGKDVYGVTSKEEQKELKDAADGVNERLFEFTGL